MTAQSVYAAIVVSDLGAASWYQRTLGCRREASGDGWVSLEYPDGSWIELYSGDPRRPGETLPSYGGAVAPPVLPGYAVDDPDEAAHGLVIARRLPGWVVVVAPDGLRVALTCRDTVDGVGLTGFRLSSPDPASQREFLARIGVASPVIEGPVAVVPVVAADRDVLLADPDGTSIALTRAVRDGGGDEPLPRRSAWAG